MNAVTIQNEYDPDLRIVLAPPGGERTEEAFAEWFDNQARREYFARYELVREFAVEPKGPAFVELMRAWSGLPNVAWADCFAMCEQGCVDHVLLDPRTLLDGSDESAAHLAALEVQGVKRSAIEQWIRQYPRKGPLGRAQFVIAKFAWGYYGCRAAEPSEWFDVEDHRKSGRGYAVVKSFVKSCTLFPPVSDVLSRNQSTPALVTILGSIIRTAAGEDLAKRVGESSGA